MQVMSRMDTCFHMKIIFSSSVRMASEFAETIAQRDDVWNVKCSGLDVSFVASSSKKLHKLAQDFERQWLERKIAEAEAALAASIPAPPSESAESSVQTEAAKEDFEDVQVIIDPSVPLAAAVGLNPEGYLLGIEEGEDLAGEEEEESAPEDSVDDIP